MFYNFQESDRAIERNRTHQVMYISWIIQNLYTGSQTNVVIGMVDLGFNYFGYGDFQRLGNFSHDRQKMYVLF